VKRISIGRVIVATWEPHETTVLETIRDRGLELQVIFNKGAVMVLPAGVNKASGMDAATAASSAAGWDPSGAEPSPEELERWTEFHCQVEALPAEGREVFDLLWYHELTQEEAAADGLASYLQFEVVEQIRRELDISLLRAEKLA
jgi:hypothetical protein